MKIQSLHELMVRIQEPLITDDPMISTWCEQANGRLERANAIIQSLYYEKEEYRKHLHPDISENEMNKMKEDEL